MPKILSKLLLTVVIPLRNYDHGAPSMIRHVAELVAPLVSDYEIIIVDNGSNDEEFADYVPLLAADGTPNLQIYRLIQRVDYDIAAWVGIENSIGDYVLIHDPRSENLSRLADALGEVALGREIVYLRNTATTDAGLLEGVLGSIFRRTFRRLTTIDLLTDAPLGRLMSKRVVSFLLQQPRPDLRCRALPSLSGFSKVTLSYTMPRRPDPARGFLGRARAAITLLVINTMAPLRIVSSVALVGAMLNALYSMYVLAVVLVKRDVAPGWTTLSLQLSGMFFLISLVMFVFSEYLIRMIRWTINGPSYFLVGEATSAVLTRRQKLNVEKSVDPEPAIQGVIDD